MKDIAYESELLDAEAAGLAQPLTLADADQIVARARVMRAQVLRDLFGRLAARLRRPAVVETYPVSHEIYRAIRAGERPTLGSPSERWALIEMARLA